MDLTGFVILICACIVLYLDVFRWDLISKFRNKKLVYEWINFKWGEKGVRITTGYCDCSYTERNDRFDTIRFVGEERIK
ncbi:hypothetical protein [Lacrimispora sp.]|uniref:hypothetical protein n=1 Tax=Lacrimispora sp. TaxID=2719234 RepID=UPI00289C5001|nr:hypothetical protein [Lacrimispora sp.]